MMFKATMELVNRLRFWASADRLGPDIPLTHWRLYFPRSMEALCRSKFKRFGKQAEFRPGAYAIACSRIQIGKRVVIRPETMLFADGRENGAGITIEDDVLIGSGVHMYTTNHNFGSCHLPIIDQGHKNSQEIVLRRGCWIGAKVIILPGVEIGENAVIGAGSVVTKSVPPHSLAVGNPSQVIKKFQNPEN